MTTIEYRLDTYGIPHTYIVIDNGNGIIQMYGFAPAQNGHLWGKGHIFDESISGDGGGPHEYNVTTGPIQISPEQYNRVINAINDAINNPPYYNLPASILWHDAVNQCATWADYLAGVGGFRDKLPWGNNGWNPFLQAVWTLLDQFWKKNPDATGAEGDPFTGMPWPGISPTVNTATTGALALDRLPPVVDCPLILDLDGGGISNSGIEPGSPILFDHDGDGLRNASGWVGAGEAIVVRDLDGNGTIDSGLEIFGDNTLLTRGPKVGQRAANGFEALADLDSNNDGQFNAADAAFASVKLWKDANQNGISEAGELFTFAQLGVQGIKVAGKRDGTALTDALGAPTGNTQTLVGSFTWANGGSGQAGTTALAADLIFATNAFCRRFSDDPTLTAAALALPNMQGSGLVRDLRAAGEALRER